MSYLAYCVLTEEANERVFSPPCYRVYNDINEVDDDDDVEYVDEWKELTPAGEEYYNKYCEDASHGYDLCFGKAKGLASMFTHDQFCSMLMEDNEYTFRKYRKETYKGFPMWAVCYLVNGDADCLEEKDTAMIDKYLDDLRKKGMATAVPKYTDEEDLHSYFDPYPAFGLACDCCDIEVLFYE